MLDQPSAVAVQVLDRGGDAVQLAQMLIGVVEEDVALQLGTSDVLGELTPGITVIGDRLYALQLIALQVAHLLLPLDGEVVPLVVVSRHPEVGGEGG